MNFDQVQNYSWYRPGSDLREDKSKPLPDPIIEDDVVEYTDKNRAILEAVYAVDPISKFPTGDIACYVSDKTSPDIKNWILNNLMIDVSSAQVPKAPAGVGDDVIEALMRNRGESTESYAERVNQYMKDQVYAYNRMIELSQQPKQVEEEVFE